MTIRTYSELVKFRTFAERFEYLKLAGCVGQSTFGFDRYLNQALYHSRRWQDLRNKIIIRDDGCDLAMDGYYICDKVIIHHINPITVEDIENQSEEIFNPDFLVCVSSQTHNAIHFGDERLLPRNPITRIPGDTKLW